MPTSEATDHKRRLHQSWRSLEGRLELEKKTCTYLEVDRALLAERLEHGRLRREEAEGERDEVLRRLKTLEGLSRAPEAAAEELERQDPVREQRRPRGLRAALVVAEGIR